MENAYSQFQIEDSSGNKPDYLPATENHMTSSLSNSETGSRGSRTDYELIECNDSNGQYVVMKRKSSPDNDATRINGIAESIEAAPMGTPSTSANSTPMTFTAGTSTVAKPAASTTPTSLSLPDSQTDGKKWVKSPSSPVFPVASQGSTTTPRGLSTPTHVTSSQEDRLSPPTHFHSNEQGLLPYAPDNGEGNKFAKQGSRKKKRSPSWYSVISPSSKQKNENFHKTFKEIPDSEQLMLDYTCALMKDILVQGKLYASQNYVCFHSNILKWQTAMVMKFQDVEQISKEKTVKVFPNAIQIRMKGCYKSPTFTSFTQRDRVFVLLCKLWQNSRKEKPLPAEELLRSLRNNNSAPALPSSEDENSKQGSPTKQNCSKPPQNFDSIGKTPTQTVVRVSDYDPSTLAVFVTTLPCQVQNMNDCDKTEVLTGGSKSSSDYGSSEGGDLSDEQDSISIELDASGLPVHAKCDLRRVFLNREYPVPAEHMFKTIFDPECDFWKNFLLRKGSFDVLIGGWEDGIGDNEGDQMKRLSYNLALTNPLGPKSIKVEETQIFWKDSVPSYCYAVDCIARTIGAPYANYFATVMRYCIRRVSDRACELRITAQIDYRKTPWGLVKNFIEKNANEGIEENFQLLEQELETYFSRHPQRLFYIAPGEDTGEKSQVRRRKKTGRGTQKNESTTRSPRSGSAHEPSAVTEQNQITAAPSTGPVAVPCNNTNSYRSYNAEPRYQVEPKSGKLFYMFIVIIFLSLLWSNYQMYERLNVLEQLHSRVTSNQAFETMSCDSLHDNSGKVCNIMERISSLENLIQKHVKASDTGWRHIIKEWGMLREEIDRTVKKVEAKDST